MNHVTVLGAWHLGSVVGCCLAEAGNEVWLWDQNSRVASSWKAGVPPLKEPGLAEMATKYFGRSLFWAGDRLTEAARRSHWVILAYDTPINSQDEVILDEVLSGFDKFLGCGFPEHTNFLFTSQLPVGTTRRLRSRIKEIAPSWRGHVLYMPENLRLGEAVRSFQAPDRAVLGLDTTDARERERLVAEFQQLTGNNKTPLNIMGIESAEMVKHALNSFLATCVVYANELSSVCESVGADAWEVLASLKQDSRVGSKAYLRPGLGYAGGTLARDVKTLSRFSGGDFFGSIYGFNSSRNAWILEKAAESFESLDGAKFVLLGVTYKPFTSTVRRSPALEIGELLRKRGARCVALDPQADLSELTDKERQALPFELVVDPFEAFEGADAAITITEWPQFVNYDWERLSGAMRSKVMLDTRNLFGGTEAVRHFSTVRVPGIA